MERTDILFLLISQLCAVELVRGESLREYRGNPTFEYYLQRLNGITLRLDSYAITLNSTSSGAG